MTARLRARPAEHACVLISGPRANHAQGACIDASFWHALIRGTRVLLGPACRLAESYEHVCFVLKSPRVFCTLYGSHNSVIVVLVSIVMHIILFY